MTKSAQQLLDDYRDTLLKLGRAQAEHQATTALETLDRQARQLEEEISRRLAW